MTPISEIEILLPVNQWIGENLQKQPKMLQNGTCWPKYKLGQPVRSYSTCSYGTSYLLIVQHTCQNVAKTLKYM